MKKWFLPMALGLFAVALGTLVLNKPTVEKVDATTFTPNEVEVVSLRRDVITPAENRIRLLIQLSDTDWNSNPITVDSNGKSGKINQYNFAENILVNGNPAEFKAGWTDRGMFYTNSDKTDSQYRTDIILDLKEGDDITFKEGCQFPSYEFVMNDTGNNAYVVKEDVTFTWNGSSFVKQIPVTSIDVNVTSIDFAPEGTVTSYFYMKSRLDDYDYFEGEWQDTEWNLGANTNLKESIFFDGVLAQYDAARGNRFRVGYQQYITIMSGDINTIDVDTITIAKGAQYPSKEFHDNPSSKVLYVTVKEANFIRDGLTETGWPTFKEESVYMGELQTMVGNAKKDLESYRGGAEKFTYNKVEYDAAMISAKALLDMVDRKTEVEETIAAAKLIIDAVKDDEEALPDAKFDYKAELTVVYGTYDLDDYKEKGDELTLAYNNGIAAIDAATNIVGVKNVFENSVAQMAAVKSDATILAEYKVSQKAVCTEFYSKVNKDDYTEENYKTITDLYNKVLTDIDSAESKAAVDSLVLKFQKDVNDVSKIQPKKGCGGSIIATSGIVSLLAIAGATIVLSKKRKSK